MVEHLETAGMFSTEKQHLLRIKEFFNDSQIISLNDKPIGLLKLAMFDDHLHIRQFQILPKVQGKGVGSKVLEDVINRALKRNLSITLNVLLANPALELYLRSGFIITGQNELEYQMVLNHIHLDN
ncbi:MAG: GNAT family N-acetyltransferase [Gammaproteobacteria bacterium]|nr:MAG: GNAT family N-acetyltransferase [Gammaproteobacteria bacterium]